MRTVDSDAVAAIPLQASLLLGMVVQVFTAEMVAERFLGPVVGFGILAFECGLAGSRVERVRGCFQASVARSQSRHVR